ncbi:MAG TPA: tRNA uridine-5-carboxymethylaminomethyl(34) synthesis GTPase MnmE [Gammaproteobacteria bacterium]|nr:tRNA uridine-5-carboxymethylaminomethyl(34) synthesis GTPase MnmE [Gammaproteobacteria bacterium]
MSNVANSDTIAAIATAVGQAAVGMVRLSGPAVLHIAKTLLGQLPPPRTATLRYFKTAGGETVDQGLALYFPAPHSFTGEAMLELQGHGNPVVLDKLLSCVCDLGARLAEPGEFSQRAFLNGRLDLVQAEAIADLISSRTDQAARAALQSLRGTFSSKLRQLIERLTTLRVQIEADIDFPEEETTPLYCSQQQEAVEALATQLTTLLDAAAPTVLYQQGLRIVLAGAPNVGKSSLLNALLGEDRAIVSTEPGTTRDLLFAQQHLHGIPVEFVDTAGLLTGVVDNSKTVRPIGEIEREGIRRAEQAIDTADVVLQVIDDSPGADKSTWNSTPPSLQTTTGCRLIQVYNKIDLSGRVAGLMTSDSGKVAVSALTGAGLKDLKALITINANQFPVQGAPFLARRRHLEAMKEALACVQCAQRVIADNTPELVAEDLRLAQNALGRITGAVSSDDLLGEIFSSFCIGK